MTDLNASQNFSLVTPETDTLFFGRNPAVEAGESHIRRIARQSGLPITFSHGVPSIPAFGPGHQIALRAKRVLDIVATALALVALLPLMVLVAVAIKIASPGPIFFRQWREGIDGRLFEVLKFRSMHLEIGDPSGVQQTVENDPRIFALGRFLRKTSIDELPQLINVLRGEMSLVGPRPHVPGMRAAGRLYRDLVPYYDLRLKVRPGLTGWAQANGYRGGTDSPALARARVDHDIAYICHFSIWLDLKIILLTLKKEFLGGSGY